MRMSHFGSCNQMKNRAREADSRTCPRPHSDAIEAPSLRLEYIKTMNWIEIFDRKRGVKK